MQKVKYFEGIDKTDTTKLAEFEALKAIGYELKTLERKTYTNSPKFKAFKCKKCNQKNTVEILKESETLKSNVDVYLCSELMGDILLYKRRVHAIILTCDGDYAEMIKNVLDKNPNVYISVFATPFTKYNNYLSVRLKELERVDRYFLVNALNIKDKVSEPQQPKKRELHRSGTLER